MRASLHQRVNEFCKQAAVIVLIRCSGEMTLDQPHTTRRSSPNGPTQYTTFADATDRTG